MKKKRGKQYEADSLYFKNLVYAKTKCMCGHIIVMSYKNPFKICSYCGRKVLNKRISFKEKLKSMLEEDKNE